FTRRLAVFVLDDPEPLLYHDEPIWRDGALVGRIASGAYGHTIGRAVGLGWVACPDGVTEAFVASGRWEVEIACERMPARAPLAPPSDPKSRRRRGWAAVGARVARFRPAAASRASTLPGP